MDETPSEQEQRAVRRFTLQLPVTVKAAAGKTLNTVAESRDVSSHGICFYCDAAVEPNSSIDFTVTLPAEVTMTEPITVRCRGTVVRVDNAGETGQFAVAAAINSYEFAPSEKAEPEAAPNPSQPR